MSQKHAYQYPNAKFHLNLNPIILNPTYDPGVFSNHEPPLLDFNDRLEEP